MGPGSSSRVYVELHCVTFVLADFDIGESSGVRCKTKPQTQPCAMAHTRQVSISCSDETPNRGSPPSSDEDPGSFDFLALLSSACVLSSVLIHVTLTEGRRVQRGSPGSLDA